MQKLYKYGKGDVACFFKDAKIISFGERTRLGSKLTLHPVEHAIYKTWVPVKGTEVYVLYRTKDGKKTKAAVPKRLQYILKYMGVETIYLSNQDTNKVNRIKLT
jgi:hypothetical protein